MRKIYLLLFSLCMVGMANAQSAANYSFATNTSGSLTSMSAGTSILVGPNTDDTPSPLTSIGFDFFFQGVRYSQFSVNENGVLRLNGIAQSNTPYKPLGQASLAIITAYGADQRTHVGDGKIHYKVLGSAPSRTLVIEWLNNQANFDAAGVANLTYQVKLSESTGVIEFVYGSMTMSTLGAASTDSRDPHIGFSSSNVANTVGSVTAPQSGTPAPTFDGTLATAVANLYVAGPITTLTSAADGSRRVFTFTPPAPSADPTGLNFTAITGSSMTLNWNDNASNEVGYAIYRSTDGINFTFASQAAANATSSVQSGLLAGTLYFWKVYAVTEGNTGLLPTTGSAATTSSSIVSTLGGGNWSAPGTWLGGVVPTATDNVLITDGSTVTIDIPTAVCNHLNVGLAGGALLQYDAVASSTLSVSGNVTVSLGSSFTAGAGTITHNLNIGGTATSPSEGSIINNGTFDMNTTAMVTTTFFGNLNGSVSGLGATTDFYAITVNKGTNQTDATIDITIPITMSVVSTSTSRLIITAGTFKLSSATNITPIGGSQTVCAAIGRLWLNHPGAVYNGGAAGSPTVTGELRIDDGTFNYGSGNNTLTFTSGSGILRMSSGTINMLGAVSFPSSAGTRFIMSGGNFNVDPQATNNLAAGTAIFSIGTSTNVNWTGGTVTIVDPHSAVAGTSFVCATTQTTSGSNKFLGGTATLSLGDGVSVTPSTAGNTGGFAINTGLILPNVIINNRTDGSTTRMARILTNSLNVSGTITINTNGYLFIGSGTTTINLVLNGGSAALVNNGTLAGCEPGGTQSIGTLYSLASNGAQTVTGSGTFVNIATLSIDNLGSSLSISTTNPYKTRRVNLFDGSLDPGTSLVVGNQSAAVSENPIIQYGSGVATLAAGTFVTFPTLDETEGQRSLFYSIASNSFVVGFNNELGTGAQTITQLLINNANGVTIPADRTITIGGTLSGTLTMALGNIFLAGSTPLTLGSSALAPGTYTYTAGTIVGKFRRWISAATGNRDFPVGIATAKRNASINFTGAPTSGGTLTAEWISTPGGTNGLPLTEGAINVTSTSNAGFWRVAAADGLGGGTYTGTFTATGIAGVTDVTQLVLLKRVDPSSPWVLNGTHVTGAGTPAAPIVSRTGMTGFSDFGVGSSDLNVLPASLLTFSGYKENTGNVLKWTTLSEQNNNGFELQRSSDGSNYTVIGFVNSQAINGNSAGILNYTFVDNAPTGAKQFYRLRQVNLDGRSNLSNIVLIKGDRSGILAIGGVFPNPANETLNISIDVPSKDKVTILVVDAMGRPVLQKTVNVESGSNTVPVDVSRLTGGSYIVKLVNAKGETVTTKFVKQ